MTAAKLKPEYSSEWISYWFKTLCKKFGWMVIASKYQGNDLKIRAYLEEMKQLHAELGKMKTRDAAIMMKKLSILSAEAQAILTT